MSMTALRAAIAAAATVPVLAFAAPTVTAAPVPLPVPVQPTFYNPQQGPFGAAATCAPNLLIPFFGGIAFNICWA